MLPNDPRTAMDRYCRRRSRSRRTTAALWTGLARATLAVQPANGARDRGAPARRHLRRLERLSALRTDAARADALP